VRKDDEDMTHENDEAPRSPRLADHESEIAAIDEALETANRLADLESEIALIDGTIETVKRLADLESEMAVFDEAIETLKSQIALSRAAIRVIDRTEGAATLGDVAEMADRPLPELLAEEMGVSHEELLRVIQASTTLGALLTKDGDPDPIEDSRTTARPTGVDRAR
jgi:uncharacterized coiled-coil protein SlyX